MEKTKVEIAENLALRELLHHLPVHRPVHCCWEWNRFRNDSGYGVIVFDGFHFTVHRLSFKHFKGLIPSHLEVMHDCDYPPCFNPDHLFLGSHQDNVDDSIRKGRRRIREASTVDNSWAWLNPPPSHITPAVQRWDELLLEIAGKR